MSVSTAGLGPHGWVQDSDRPYRIVYKVKGTYIDGSPISWTCIALSSTDDPVQLVEDLDGYFIGSHHLRPILAKDDGTREIQYVSSYSLTIVSVGPNTP